MKKEQEYIRTERIELEPGVSLELKVLPPHEFFEGRQAMDILMSFIDGRNVQTTRHCFETRAYTDPASNIVVAEFLDLIFNGSEGCNPLRSYISERWGDLLTLHIMDLEGADAA